MRVSPGRPNALPRRTFTHTHTHAYTQHNQATNDQDYKRDSVQPLTYKVMESRAGDIRGRATLTGVNKITVDAASSPGAGGVVGGEVDTATLTNNKQNLS